MGLLLSPRSLQLSLCAVAIDPPVSAVADPCDGHQLLSNSLISAVLIPRPSSLARAGLSGAEAVAMLPQLLKWQCKYCNLVVVDLRELDDFICYRHRAGQFGPCAASLVASADVEAVDVR